MYVCMYVCMLCVCVSLTGDLHSGHVDRDCVCMCVCVCVCVSLTVFGSCRQGVCTVCVCVFP